MNTTEKNIDFQVQLWALVGPLIALATAATILIKGTPATYYLPWVLLVGVVLSWKWKVRGLIASVVALIVAVAFNYSDIPTDERAWHVGLAVAMAMTFFVTALSFDEIESLIVGMEKESSSRLKSLLQLDEKLESVQSKLIKEKEALSLEVREHVLKAESYERLIAVTREEILTTHAEQEKLLQELFEARHQLKKIQDKGEPLNIDAATQEALIQRDREIEELRLQLAEKENDQPLDAVAHKYKSRYEQLREQFEEKGRILDDTRKDLFKAKERALVVEREQEQRLLDRTDLELELERCLSKTQERCAYLEAENQKLEELIASL